ncbi:MAG: aldo/keto reductase [Acidobacteriota bacterium]
MVTKLDRRRFFSTSFAGAAGMMLSPALGSLASARSATDRVQLGGTGIEVSRIAMGTGFNGFAHSSAQVRLGKTGFTSLMHHGFDSGLNFFDMADMYGSHHFMRGAISEIGRDRMVLLSKIWFAGGGGEPPTDRAVPAVERFLGELNTDHLDVCLIHCATDASWATRLERMRDELSELKQKGVIRAKGVSCHDLGALKVAASDPWVDVIFSRINNRAKVMDAADPNVVADVLRKARANGKAVVGMKIFGAGQLVQPQQREESLRYVWGNDLVNAMTIGFEHPEQVDDTIARLNGVLRA